MVLQSVVVYINKQMLDAIIEDDNGKLRKISYRWRSREATPLPTDWFSAVVGEIEYQQAEELAQKRGILRYK